MTRSRNEVREKLLKLLGSVYFCAVAIICLFIFFWKFLHIGDLYRIGSDEGYETLKGSLYVHGFRLYKEIWDDQPPLYTWLLAIAFKSFGTLMPVARLVASGFGVLMFAATFAVVRLSAGPQAGWLACLVLLVSPETLQLSLSVMQEVPAMSLALCSVWAAWSWKQKEKIRWLILSGLLMGVALQIKLTAAILIPALLFDLAVDAIVKSGPCLAGGISYGRNAATWICFLALAFFGIVACFPGWSVDLIWFTHAAASVGAKLRGSGSFQWSYFANAAPMVVGAIMFLLVTMTSSCWKKFAFYYAFLLTVVVIHIVHRPFWDYYMLHFGLAMALPAGIVMSRFFKEADLSYEENEVTDFVQRVANLCGFTMLLFVFAVGGPVLYRSCKALRHSERISEVQLPTAVQECRNKGGLLFTIAPLQGFYSGIPVVPFLAVLSPVRYWAGQISDAKILTTLKGARPAYLLLPNSYLDKPEWASLVNQDYEAISAFRGEVFYEKRTFLNKKSEPATSYGMSPN
ncbi:hypothetical protein GC207_15740 [bacterium]|nr:hypothetical protein [bacterium]